MSVAIYLADPHIRAEQIEAIRTHLPAGWTLAERPEGATAILTEKVDISAGMLAAAGASLRLVARLDTGAATVAAANVPVVDLPNTALTGVAEHTVSLILALSRRLLWVARQTADRQWLPGRDQPILTDQRRYTYNWVGLEDFGTLYRKTVGIVGLGYIGRATAARLRPFGVRLLYTRRHRLAPDEEACLGVQWHELDDLLRESDFVSLHHRFQEGPEGNDKQFGAREFGLMKPTAYFINTARGRMVDEEALVEVLRSGRIAGAGLDVFRFEPLPADHPLLSLAGDKVILTAHVAGAPATEAWQTIAQELFERVQAML
ncbi:MAG: hypothetical protein M5U01_00925 [Ardenticatenaceae bacterium]|nr:hypothetical protein [Ardenticatenaceae bacterium]